MTENEKRVLMLSKTLPDVDADYLDELSMRMSWYDWDCNCPYADFIRIGQCCEEYQVIRTFDVEMDNCWAMVNKNKPEDYPDWASEVDIDDFDEWEEDGETFTDLFYHDREIYGEFTQHWVNCKTGEVVMLGKTEDKDSYYCNTDNAFKLIRRDTNPKFYDAFNSVVGHRTQHVDLSVNKLLLAQGYEALILEYDEDLNYVSDGIASDYYNICGEWHTYLSLLVQCVLGKRMLAIFGIRAISYLDDDDFITAFHIAVRHNYELPMSFDNYVAHIKNLKYLGKDLHNPHYVAPTNELCDLIDRQARNKKRRELEESERERRRKEAYESEHADEIFYELRKDFLPIQFSNEHYAVHVLQSRQEYFEEGEAMHHCVGKMNFWKKPSSICVGIRSLDGHREATAEVSLQNFRILQCYTYCDKVHEHDEEIRQLILDHIWLFQAAAKGETINQLQIAI